MRCAKCMSRSGQTQLTSAIRIQNLLSRSHSALPLRPGVLSSLLSYWARTTCHVTYSPDRDAPRPGPPTSSRHYGVGPTTTVGATIRVTEPPPYRSALGLSRLRRARTEGAGADDFSLRPRPPSRGRRRTVVPLWFRRSRRGSSGGQGGPCKERTVTGV